jgi:hypothetical protein
MAWHNASGEQPANVELDAIAYMLYLKTWIDKDESYAEWSDEFLQRLYEKWVTQWLPSLSEPHCGDCTNVSATCIRCSVERIYKDAARILEVSNGE